jgi:carboxypeptidase C (cathepsin A)
VIQDATKPEGDKKEARVKEDEFFQMNRDLDSLCEFMQKFLSKNKRWESPVFIAGESYGGFRAAKLSKKLQEETGIGLSGTILISPALEVNLLNANDYDALAWSNAVPTMALTAAFHGKSRIFDKSTPAQEVMGGAEHFVNNELALLLAQGTAMAEEKREEVLHKMADLTGLSREYVIKSGGRISIVDFARELMREDRNVCGLYDATQYSVDPFPDRTNHEGPDSTLFSIERVFTGGINTQLRSNLGVESEREYTLLSMNVNTSWKIDGNRHAFDRLIGATDDLRYAMTLNPHMKVFLTHGLFDLVTPYYASNRIVQLMKVDDRLRDNLQVKHFNGGHMFYTWEKSRKEFTSAIRDFVQNALGNNR